MSEPPIDLSPLDPEIDDGRRDRVVGGAMRRIRGGDRPVTGWARIAATLVVGVALGWVGRGFNTPEQLTLSAADLANAAPGVTLAGLFDELDLSADQRSRVRVAVESRSPESDELLVAVARELQRMIAERDDSIRQVLLPDQRTTYDQRVGSGSLIGFRRDYLFDRAHVRIEAYLR